MGNNLTGATAVTFNWPNPAVNPPTVVTAIQLQGPGAINLTVPPSVPPGTPGTVCVTVTVPQAPTPVSACNSNSNFTYQQALPQVLAVSPNIGTTLGGDSVTIRGSGFINVSNVQFGAAGTITCGSAPTTTPPTKGCTNWDPSANPPGPSDTLITITQDTPADASCTGGNSCQVDVQVTNPTGQSAVGVPDEFNYVPLATVTSVATGSPPTNSGPA
jgi:hypothetical protein